MSDPLDRLMPHRPPMRWLRELVSCTDTSAVATARFEEGDFAVAGVRVMESALVECVAQTVAAAQGSRARAGGPWERHGGGMLVAVSAFRLNAPVPLDRNLTIEVRELKRFGPMLLVAGTISCDGQLLASGELTLNA